MKIIKKISLYLAGTILLLELALQVTSIVYQKLNQEPSSLTSNSIAYYNILVLGESTSYGALLEDRLREAYPYLLKSLLAPLDTGKIIQVKNLSYPGQISDSILISAENYLSKNKVDLVISQFGVNDVSAVLNPFISSNVIESFVFDTSKRLKILKLVLLSYYFIKYRENFTLTEDDQYIFSNDNLNDEKDHLHLLNRTRKNIKKLINILNRKEIPYLMLSYFESPIEVNRLIKEESILGGGKYLELDLELEPDKDKYFANDDWHPNAHGHSYIASKILKLIEKEKAYFFSTESP